MQINIENLFFSYDEDTILKDISLNIEKGDFIGIIGHTGSGKSTLLKHLNGILRADSGKVDILDREITKESRKLKELRKKVGVVFQFPEEQLFSETIKKDIYFGPKNFGLSDEEIEKNLEELKKTFHLTDELLEKSFNELSGGEKRRSAIASVMVSKPEILILDEPTIGLDYENRLSLLELLKKINEAGTTIIIVSHDLYSTWSYLKNIAILEHGEIIFTGDKASLLKKRELLKNENLFFPTYIDFLINRELIYGNEEKAITKEGCNEIIREALKGI